MATTTPSEQEQMHPDEVRIDVPFARRLLADQFPYLSHMPLAFVRSTGTVNAICRIGDELYARLPRVARWANSLSREIEWLPTISRHVRLAVPEPLAEGNPTGYYPFPWAIYRWLRGEPYSDEEVQDECTAARDLANFEQELRTVAQTNAPRAGRAPLAELDQITQSAIRAAEGSIDVQAASVAWAKSLKAPRWDGKPQWIHADLLRPNLLLRDGRLYAVIDFGGVGVGDPAADVIAAWAVLGKRGRDVYREALSVDDGTWDRGRGYALHQALRIVPYYRETNPEFVNSALRTINEVLTETR